MDTEKKQTKILIKKRYKLTPGAYLRLAFLVLLVALSYSVYYFIKHPGNTIQGDLMKQGIMNYDITQNFTALPAYAVSQSNGQFQFNTADNDNEDVKINLSADYSNPINIKIGENATSINISDENGNGFQSSVLADFGNSNGNKFVRYQSNDGRKNIYYSYQKDAEHGQLKLKNWIVYKSGDGGEKEIYKIENAALEKNQNGGIDVYYSDVYTDQKDDNGGEKTAKIPDLVIDRPFYFDKNGHTHDVDWQIGEKGEFSLEFSAGKNDYPITLDPTITHNAKSQFDTGSALNRIESIAGPRIGEAYHELPADQYTVGLWHMNENANGTCVGSKDVCDSSGRNNDGTVTGTTIAIDAANQKLGSAARNFNGVNDAVSTPNMPSVSGNSVTLEAWVKTSSVPSSQQFIAGQYGGTDIVVQSSGTVAIISYLTDNWYAAADPNPIPTNQWVHYAGTLNYNPTYGVTTLNLYKNGVLVATNSYGRAPSANDGCLNWIGGVNGTGGCAYTGQYFKGEIDEVRISNIARSADEIKTDAQRYPYSIYNSSLMDLSSLVSGITKINWTENGVKTGDGETLYSNTNLIAQWNFNEASGTTAANSGGASSCGGTQANCNGTLINFNATCTGSQDACPTSTLPAEGWTANNRRWGAGALKFDGLNDYINAGTSPSYGMASGDDYSIEFWMKTTDRLTSGGYNRVILSMSQSTNYYWYFYINSTTGKLAFTTLAGNPAINSDVSVDDGEWKHVVFKRQGGVIMSYINGVKQSQTLADSNAISVQTLYIGTSSIDVTKGLFDGVLDSMRIYKRALSTDEILSNYNAGEINFQTRTGATTNPDDGTWEAWKPAGTETTIDSMDSTITSPSSISGLSLWLDANDISTIHQDPSNKISQWDDKSGNGNNVTQATGSQQPLYVTNVINGKPVVRFSAAASQTMTNATDFSSHATVIYVSRLAGTTNGRMLSGLSNNWLLGYYNNSKRQAYFGDWVSALGGNVAGTAGTNWGIYGAIIPGGNSISTAYINGMAFAANNVGTAGPQGISLDGHQGTAQFSDGDIAEVIIYNRALNDQEFQLVNQYLANKYNLNSSELNVSSQTNIKQEGTGALKISNASQADGDTMGLWHLDETSGDATDSGGTIGTLLASGTAPGSADGVSIKARTFNGNSYFSCTDASCGGTLKTDIGARSWTASAWIKTTTGGVFQGIVSKMSQPSYGWTLRVLTTNVAEFGVSSNGSDWYDAVGTTVVTDGKWHQVTGVYAPGSSVSIYVDGILQNSNSASIPASVNDSSADFTIGKDIQDNNTHNFIGSIDEVTVSSSAKSGYEIAENYRTGREQHVIRSISSTDLSGKNKIPFYVAADRPGTYLKVTAGESAFANDEPDANTKALFHFEERTASTDSSGGNNSDFSGPGGYYMPGKIGYGRYFGATQAISLGTSTSLDFGNNGPFTISGWVNPYSLVDSAGFVGKDSARGTGAGSYTYSYLTAFMSNGRMEAYNGSSWLDICPAGSVVAMKWQHVAFVYDGTTLTGYVDGAKCGAAAFSYTDNSGHYVYIGSWYSPATTYDYSGLMDEVRIDNVARSADDIRQAFEFNNRSQIVTVDFSASLDAGNLITDSNDKSFTIDARGYGMTQRGANLYPGDKIIVRENVGGTEFMAQGTVNAVNALSGAVAVNSWDAGSTFPSGAQTGFSSNASVFKWQREYWDISSIPTWERDGITRLSLHTTDDSNGHTIYVDDFKSLDNYLTDPVASGNVTSTTQRYMQYRSIISSSDTNGTPSVSSVNTIYTDPYNNNDIMKARGTVKVRGNVKFH